MGIRDFIRRHSADAENQGNDFIEDDSYIVPAEQCKNPKEVTDDDADDQAG